MAGESLQGTSVFQAAEKHVAVDSSRCLSSLHWLQHAGSAAGRGVAAVKDCSKLGCVRKRL